LAEDQRKTSHSFDDSKLETALGGHIHEHFDLVCGTSTGAIIATALTTPAQPGSQTRQLSRRVSW
jgi:patatin-like phospholipase/acyl hydrolase